MSIYILRDNQELGPFSEETTQTMLKQGAVSIGDLAWSPGMADWLPLHSVLYPAQVPQGEQRPPPPPGGRASSASSTPAESGEPATPKQQAFLTFMGVPFSPALSKEQASVLMNDAMEDPKNTGRLALWDQEKLRLHPALFAEEIQARKDNRANHFFGVCQGEGAEYFTKVTKAHCQVLVSYLDVSYPHWDARESEAARHYFFPAIAEKFPALVQSEWKGKLLYPTGPKVAAELTRRAPGVSRSKSTRRSPLSALTRGVFFGLLILGMLWFGYRVSQGNSGVGQWGNHGNWKAALNNALPKSKETTQASENDATSPRAVAPLSDPSGIPKEATAPTAPGVNATPNAMNPVDAPSSMAPATESGFTPFSPDSPSTTAPGSTSLVPEAPPTRTSVLLTKPTDVQMAYGKITLPAGTSLKLVGRDGANLKVIYFNNVVPVRADSTDIDKPLPAPAPAPTPAATAPSASPPAVPPLGS